MPGMVDLFAALPASLAQSVLTEWLDWRGVGRLDSAMVNKQKRAEFIELLRSAIFCQSFSARKSGCQERRYFDWFIARSLKVTNLNVTNESTERVRLLLSQTGECLQFIQADQLDLVAEKCTNLSHLVYSGMNMDLIAFYRVLSNNSMLQHLELGGRFTGEPGELQFDKVNLPHLRVLSVRTPAMSLFEESSLCLWLSLIPKSSLVHTLSLSLSNVGSTKSMLTILSRCPLLRTLEASYFPLDDQSLVAVASLCPLIVNLDVSHSSVTDVGIEHAARHLQLRSVHLNGCESITANSLSALLKYSHSTLTTLSILDTFTDVASPMRVTLSLCAILTSCKLLTTLCTNSTHLREGYMQHLTKLYLYGEETSDKVVQFVARNCTSVEYLCLQDETGDWESEVLEDSVRALIHKCTKLHTLVIVSNFVHKVRRILAEEYATRVPKIALSGYLIDIKCGVMDEVRGW